MNFVCPIFVNFLLPLFFPGGNLEIRHGGRRSPVAIDHGQIGTGLLVTQVVLGQTAVLARVT